MICLVRLLNMEMRGMQQGMLPPCPNPHIIPTTGEEHVTLRLAVPGASVHGARIFCSICTVYCVTILHRTSTSQRLLAEGHLFLYID